MDPKIGVKKEEVCKRMSYGKKGLEVICEELRKLVTSVETLKVAQ
jgi:hypothetical protein